VPECLYRLRNNRFSSAQTAASYWLLLALYSARLEQDVDIRVIQTLLGHAKLDTTALYTRVANTTIRAEPAHSTGSHH
jgi:site-specific recombinase XerD